MEVRRTSPMPLKLFLAATALAAILVGLLLPTPKPQEAQASSQIPTMEVGPG